MKQRPVIVVVLAVIKDGEVLLLKRNKPAYEGLWGFLAGKVELNENIETAALRELKEETGLDGEFVALRGIYSETIDEEKYFHFYCFLAEVKPNSKYFIKSEEGELKWIKISEMKNEKLIPDDLILMENFILPKKKVSMSEFSIKKEGEEYILENHKLE